MFIETVSYVRRRAYGHQPGKNPTSITATECFLMETPNNNLPYPGIELRTSYSTIALTTITPTRQLTNSPSLSFQYIQINFDANRQLTNITLSNGVNISFNIQMCYYVSDDPEKLGAERKKPGAYIFRPIDPHPILIADYIDARVLKTELVEELQIRFASYAGITFRLYKRFPTIEVDWVVGPIPSEDDLGKDVFVRYITDLQNDGVFYTDSNGRQTIKRIRNVRATYNPVLLTGEAGIASKCVFNTF